MFIMLVGIHPFDLEGDTSDTEILRRVSSAEASHTPTDSPDIMCEYLVSCFTERLHGQWCSRHGTSDSNGWTVNERVVSISTGREFMLVMGCWGRKTNIKNKN